MLEIVKRFFHSFLNSKYTNSFFCIQKCRIMLRLRLNIINFNPTNKEFEKFGDMKINILWKFLFCCSNNMGNPSKGLLSEVNMCEQLSVMLTRDLWSSCKLVFHMPRCIWVKVVRRFPNGISQRLSSHVHGWGLHTTSFSCHNSI